MRKAREKTNFQIFLASRFVCTLIIVIGAEYLVFFQGKALLGAFGEEHYVLSLLILIALFLFPFLGTVYWFCKLIMEEVQRMDEEQQRYLDKQ